MDDHRNGSAPVDQIFLVGEGRTASAMPVLSPVSLTDLGHDLHCLRVIQLRIDFRHCGRTVTQDDASGVQAVLLPEECGGVVAQLVRVPVMVLAPKLEGDLLLGADLHIK